MKRIHHFLHNFSLWEKLGRFPCQNKKEKWWGSSERVCFFFNEWLKGAAWNWSNCRISYEINSQNELNKLPSPDGIHPGALKELKDEITELPRMVCSLSLHQKTTKNMMSFFNKLFRRNFRTLDLQWQLQTKNLRNKRHLKWSTSGVNRALKKNYDLQNYILKGVRNSVDKSDKAENNYFNFQKDILLKW